MRTGTQVGRFGNFVCASMFCLSTSLGGSQTNSPPQGAEPPSAEKVGKSAEVLLTQQQLQEQHQQLLRAVDLIRQDTQGHLQRYTTAVDRIRKDTDATLKRFTTAVDGKLERLSQAVASERERDLQTMRESNRFALTTASVLVGLLLIEVLFIAWLSARAVNRLTTRISSWIAEQSSFPGAAVLGMDALYPLSGKVVQETSMRLQNAIERVEQRLLELEHATSRFQTTLAAPPAAQASIASAPQFRSHLPPQAKAGMASGVSLAVGHGESLIFLPHEKEITPFHTYRNFLQKLRKRFHQERSLEK